MVTIFPANPIGYKVEILLNGVWTDITAYVYMRDQMHISGIGRADWSQSVQSSQVTLTLNNRGGRFTPNNASGAYYPYIVLNTQLRISINSESSTLVVYSGYRFWGEVSEWPIAWDSTGADVYSQIVVSGIWRRMSQDQTTIGSPSQRYSKKLTGTATPQAYWSMEDGSGSKVFVGGLVGVANGTWVAGPNGGPALSSDNTSFLGSDSLPTLNQARMTFTVPAGGTTTDNVTRFDLSVPATGDSLAATFSAGAELIKVNTSGTLTSYSISLVGNQLQFQAWAGVTSKIGPTKIATKVNGVPVLVSIELTPSGGSINWAVRMIKPGAGSVLDQITGTLAATTIGAVTTISVDGQGRINNSTFGQLSVTYGSVPSLVTAAYALGGYVGEYAMDRFTRICAEFGITTETIGVNTSTQAMGPQTDDHLTDVLQLIENTDGGLLYELRDNFGLGYRSMVSMQNQSVALTLNYATGMVAQTLVPAYDDQLVANNVTVAAQDGFTIQAQLISGAMSILVPPNGIGPGYTFTKSISVAADSQVSPIAVHYLNVGTVNDFRVPSILVDLARSQAASVFATAPGMRIGDYIQVTNPPSYWTSATVKQLAWGWAETIGNKTWTIQFNTVSELPWETTFSPGTVSAIQVPGNATGSSSAPAVVSGSAIGGGTILPGQISQLTASLLGNLGVLNANPYFMGGDGTGWSGVNGTFSIVGGLIGAPYGFAGQYTNNGISAGAMEEGDSTGNGFPVTPGQQIMITGWFNSSVTSVELGFDYADAGGGFVAGPTNATYTVVAATWTQLTAVQTPPAGAAWARPRAGSPNADGSTLYAQAVTCLPQVPGSLVQAGTVTATQIATGTITAALMVAGLAVIGIVDATVVNALRYVASGSEGEFLAYTGTPGSGNLNASISGRASSDTYSNPFPIGLFGQALTLQNQGSAPPAFSGATVLYSSTAGRPRIVTSAGADMPVDRSVTNVSQFTVGNTNVPTIISAPMSYLANEGNQSSEYEIEMSGNGAGNTGAAQQLNFQLYLDGASYGGNFLIGSTFFTSGVNGLPNFRYTIRFTLAILTTGSGGTSIVSSNGTLLPSGNISNTGTACLGGISSGLAFDTTANHTLQLYAFWGGISTGQQLTTFRTRTMRHA